MNFSVWNILNLLLLLAEIAVFGFILFVSIVILFCRPAKKRSSGTFRVIVAVFAINLCVYAIPCGYSKGKNVIFYDFLDCVSNAIKHFVGEVTNLSYVTEYATAFPVFKFIFSIAFLLALASTGLTAFWIFNLKYSNKRRAVKALKKDYCDVVIGTSDLALSYAKKNPGTVVLADSGCEQEALERLIESGYTVLCRNFDDVFLKSNLLKSKNRYNFIMLNPGANSTEYINTFMKHQREVKNKNKYYLYIESGKNEATAIRHMVSDDEICRSRVTVFNTNELMARSFVEEHSVTECLPEGFITKNAAISPDKKINVFILGLTDLNREVYFQSVINNQVVCFDNGYKTLPVNYYVYDEDADTKKAGLCEWEEQLAGLEKERNKYFPLPEKICNAEFLNLNPCDKHNYGNIVKTICEKDSFSFIIVDAGASFQNVEIYTTLRNMLSGNDNFKFFVRCELDVCEKDDKVDYFGDFSKVFSHDIIVNERLMDLAKFINREYTQRFRKFTDEQIENGELDECAENEWNSSKYFTLYSNVSLAVNLKHKLNLLGLEIAEDDGEDAASILSEVYKVEEGQSHFDIIGTECVRASIIAQEHARWNAYHIMNDWVPLEKDKMVIVNPKSDPPGLYRKNPIESKHICLTTYEALKDVSQLSADIVNRELDMKCTAEQYNFYENDEMLIQVAEKFLKQFGKMIIKKKIEEC